MLGWWLPENVPTYGGGVLDFMYWTSGIAMVIAQALLSRVRRASTPSHPPLATVWAIVPALIVICLGLLSHHSRSEIARSRSGIVLEKAQPSVGLFTAASFAADSGGQ